MDFHIVTTLFDLQTCSGISKDKVLSAEEKWGHLPDVLKDFYIQLGAETNVCYICDELLQPRELYEKDGHLCFYKAAQGALAWYIKLTDLDKIDPPVVCRNTFDQSFLPACDTLSHFLCAVSCMQGINEGLPFTSEGFYPANEQLIQQIKGTLGKKEFYMDNAPRIDFYSLHDDDILAIVSNNGVAQIGYASSNEEHFEEMDSLVSQFL